jgi:hypothetical protein
MSASGRHSHEYFFEMKTSFWQVQVLSKNKEKDVQFLVMQYKALYKFSGRQKKLEKHSLRGRMNNVFVTFVPWMISRIIFICSLKLYILRRTAI